MNRDLELAKRVFPLLRVRTSNAGMRVYFDLKNGAEDFDPLGKHFPDVLAFAIANGCIVLRKDVTRYDHSFIIGTAETLFTIDHDGTAAGIAQAVYKAAIRIVEAEK